jgi:DNA-binding NtrC family response regulator
MPPSETFIAEIERLAPSRVTVLVLGGSRRARELAARSLHERSPRSGDAFLAIDCSELDGETLERRLFGGPLGAPPSAGILNEMGRGTLFVGTVDAIPSILQPRFLSFLDGDRRVRVIAGTSVDLQTEIDAKRFRADLGERLLLVQLLLASG